jgi:biopolymer transport protein ExbB/TolQ
MALVTTETGLAIAIPAFIISYHAHRQLQLGVQKLTEMESEIMETQ